VYWTDTLRNIEANHMCEVELLHHPETLRLQLRGTLLQCPNVYRSLEISDNLSSLDVELEGSDDDGFEFTFSPDQWFSSSQEDHEDDSTLASTPKEWGDDKQTRAFLKNILIMPILCFMEPLNVDGFTQMGTVMCLLLHAPPGAERGVYRRVGTVSASIAVGDDVDSDTIKVQFEAYRKPLDPHLFQEEDCHGKYTVTVM
jgi:hypothetical protein